MEGKKKTHLALKLLEAYIYDLEKKTSDMINSMFEVLIYYNSFMIIHDMPTSPSLILTLVR